MTALFPDNRHAVAAPVHQVRPAKTARRRATGQQGDDEFVAVGLPQVQAVRRERIRQVTGNVQLEAVSEEMQTYPRTGQRVVAVSHGVHKTSNTARSLNIARTDPNEQESVKLLPELDGIHS